MDLTTYEDDFLLFAESGFIAVNQSDEDSAIKLFQAASLLNPENSLPTIGMGYLYLHKLQIKKACDLFEKVLKKEPNNEMVKSFLGLCLVFSSTKVNKGEKILEETLNSEDKMVKNLSESALKFVDTFVKKKSSPIEGISKTRTKGKKHGRKQSR